MRVSTLLRHSLGMVMVGLMIIHRKRLAGEAGNPRKKKEGAKQPRSQASIPVEPTMKPNHACFIQARFFNPS
uniref:Uncharacterized protein n=1 Tax=Picea sitchensis TaxID=3332 RepID=A0A6B9XW94_PICSI|nr:hypothetical protein Q903MT_gene5530 [Picea sitchensis]